MYAVNEVIRRFGEVQFKEVVTVHSDFDCQTNRSSAAA